MNKYSYLPEMVIYLLNKFKLPTALSSVKIGLGCKTGFTH